jgi:hypothetical protein
VDVTAALEVLGLAPGATRVEVRDAYLRLVRAHHPDRADGTAADTLDRTQLTAHITEAYGVLQHAMATSGADRVEPQRPFPPPTAAAPPPPPPRAPPQVDTGEHDTILINTSAPASYALLHEAAGRIGEVAYFDRQLGILETVVRFEGGPSCSVVLTVVPRLRDVTEVQCMMESIEASPTPPIRPVVEALVEELRSL